MKKILFWVMIILILISMLILHQILKTQEKQEYHLYTPSSKDMKFENQDSAKVDTTIKIGLIKPTNDVLIIDSTGSVITPKLMVRELLLLLKEFRQICEDTIVYRPEIVITQRWNGSWFVQDSSIVKVRINYMTFEGFIDWLENVKLKRTK